METGENKRIERSTGFTLMEVVIAITIFSICVTTVYLIYSSVIGVVGNVEQVTGMDKDARVVLERLSLDLNGICRGTQGFLNGTEPADQQDGEPFLSFTSTSHLVLNPDERSGDIAVIRYYLEENDDERGYTLLRSDTALPGRSSPETGEAAKHILADDIAELKIVYIDREGVESEVWESGAGDDGQEDEDQFPQAFHISLQLQDFDETDSSPVEYTDGVVAPRLAYTFEDES